jgi:hypothetical protein
MKDREFIEDDDFTQYPGSENWKLQ